MMTEKQIRKIHADAVDVLRICQHEITIDAKETDAAAIEHCLAEVLQIPSKTFRKKSI